MRESPALDIINILARRGAEVSYTDPYVPRLDTGGHILESVGFDEATSTAWDCAVVTTDHSAFDYERIAALPLLVDTRNALKGPPKATVFKL
jgi:UDP-N-acetyl-D-glucosamine dehydrogenase